jgi:hypothetical protein
MGTKVGARKEREERGEGRRGGRKREEARGDGRKRS